MDMETVERFHFRPISDRDYELFYLLLLDEPIIQWIHEDDMEERMKTDILKTMMSFYWTLLKMEKETYSIFMKESLELVGEVTTPTLSKMSVNTSRAFDDEEMAAIFGMVDALSYDGISSKLPEA